MTFYRAGCIGEWAEMACDMALTLPALAGGNKESRRRERRGWEPGWTDPRWALRAEGNDPGYDSILILLPEAVELNLLLLPPNPSSPPGWLLLRPPQLILILSLSQEVRGWRKKKGPRKEQ